MRDDTSLPPGADEYGRRVSPYYNLEDKKAKYQADKLFKRLRRKTGQAIGDYGMIKEHDRILVGMSGGKDSYALLDLLLSLRRSAPVAFELVPVHIDAGYSGTPVYLLEEHLKKVGLEYYIIKKNIAKICADKLPPGKTWCPLCSRMRRGYLYGAAKEIGANKLALGHHKDDVLCTFFMNLFFSGIMKTMPPILRTDRDDFTLIRPLVYCRERDLKQLSRLRQYPLFPKGLCGWGEDQQRTQMRRMIASWSETYPKRADIIFKALKNVVPSHLFDKKLFDFSQIKDAAPLSESCAGFGAFPGGDRSAVVPSCSPLQAHSPLQAQKEGTPQSAGGAYSSTRDGAGASAVTVRTPDFKAGVEPAAVPDAADTPKPSGAPAAGITAPPPGTAAFPGTACASGSDAEDSAGAAAGTGVRTGNLSGQEAAAAAAAAAAVK